MFWSGKFGSCSWYYASGELSDSEMELYLSTSKKNFAASNVGDSVITIAFSAKPPTAKQRKALANLLEESQGVDRVTYHAFITNSKVAYAANTAINWLVRKPWTEKCFLEPDAAFSWLESVSKHTIDVEGLRRDIADTVDDTYLWSTLHTQAAV